MIDKIIDFLENRKKCTGNTVMKVTYGNCIDSIKEIVNKETEYSWIEIKDKNDLPKESYVFWVLRRGFKYPMYKYVEVFTEEENEYWIETYTHYQLISKPFNPFFSDTVGGC